MCIKISLSYISFILVFFTVCCSKGLSSNSSWKTINIGTLLSIRLSTRLKTVDSVKQERETAVSFWSIHLSWSKKIIIACTRSLKVLGLVFLNKTSMPRMEFNGAGFILEIGKLSSDIWDTLFWAIKQVKWQITPKANYTYFSWDGLICLRSWSWKMLETRNKENKYISYRLQIKDIWNWLNQLSNRRPVRKGITSNWAVWSTNNFITVCLYFINMELAF